MSLNFNELIKLEVEDTDYPVTKLVKGTNTLAETVYTPTVTNPDFATNTTGWTAGTGWTLTRQVGPPTNGRLTKTSSVVAGEVLVSNSQQFAAGPGEFWRMKMNLKRVNAAPSGANMNFRLNLVAYNAGGTRLAVLTAGVASITPAMVGADNTFHVGFGAVTPAGTSYIRFELVADNAWTYAGTTFGVDIYGLFLYRFYDRTATGWTANNITIAEQNYGWSGIRTGESNPYYESDKVAVTAGIPIGVAADVTDYKVVIVGSAQTFVAYTNSAQIGLKYYNASNVLVGEEYSTAETAGSPTTYQDQAGNTFYDILPKRLSFTGMVPATATKASLVIKVATGDALIGSVIFDKAVLIQADQINDLSFGGTAAANVQNQIINPSGELGVQGWTDYGSDSVLTHRNNLPANASAYDLRLGGYWNEEEPAGTEIIVIQTATGYNALYSNTTAVSPGQWVGGGALCKGRGYIVAPYTYVIMSYIAVGWQFRNSAGAVISTVMSDFELTQNDYYVYIQAPSTQAPAGTVSARMVIQNSNDSASFTTQLNGAWMMVKQAQMNVGATSGSVTAQPLTSNEHWKDILGGTHEIGIEREELEPGILTADIVDPNLDPAEFSTLVPGLKIRMRTLVDDVWTTTFSGKITNANSTYDRDLTPRITIEAADAGTILANTPSASTVATIDGLANNMPSNILWNINGQTAVGANPTIVGTNNAASVLDQVIITRDTVGGYAWVDRTGVFNAWDSTAFDLYKNKIFFRDDARPVKTGKNTNLIINPTFATNTTGWSQNGASSMVVSSGSAVLTATGGVACYMYPTTLITAVAGQTIGISVDATSAKYYRAQIAFYDQANVETGSRVNTSIVTGAQGALTASGTIPANAISCRLFIVLYNDAAGANPTAGSAVTVNRVVMVANPTADWAYEYITGDDDYAYWTGAANASTSVKDYSLYQDYLTDIEIGYNTSEVVNQVTIKQNKKNESGAYEELEFGPYEHTASVADWGPRATSVTIADTVNPDDVATRILLTNAVPELALRQVSFLVDDLDSFNKAATIDLYNQVGVRVADKIDADLRVAGISHSLVATVKNGLAVHRWKVTLFFKALTTAAQMSGGAPKPTTNKNPGAVYQMSHQNTDTTMIPNNAWTTITTWTGDESANTTYSAGTWTVSKAGRYVVVLTASFAVNTTGLRGVRPVINGNPGQNVLVGPIPTFQTTGQVYTEVRLNAGGTVSFQVFQNSGGSLLLRGDSGGLYTSCVVRWVGE